MIHTYIYISYIIISYISPVSLFFGRQHRHAAVLQLRLAQPADVDGQREAHWVEALLAKPGKSMGKAMGNDGNDGNDGSS